MGGHKFRLSDMIPNAWFFKLRDMRAARGEAGASAGSPCGVVTQASMAVSRAGRTCRMPSTPRHGAWLPHRTSYYYTPRAGDVVGSPLHPKASDTHFPPLPLSPPRRSKRRHRRRSVKLAPSVSGSSVVSSPVSSGSRWLSLRALGAPAVVVSLAIQGVFRGLKDTKTPLLYSGLGNISAAVILPFFVYSLNLGLNGAALATIASQYLGMFLLLWSLSKRAVLLPPKIEDLDFVGYIKSGGLLLGRTLSVLITMTLGTAMAARQGTLAMAAHQICLQVWLAVSLLSDALAVSAQALIASSFAKLDYEKVKEVTYYVLKTGVCVGIALALLLFASFDKLAELFSKDPMVLQIVGSGVLFVSASQPINALAFIFDGLHFGVSDFSYSASSMMVVGALSSLFLLFAPQVFGLPGVWAGLALFMSLRMTAGFLRLGWRAGPWWFLHQKEPKCKL